MRLLLALFLLFSPASAFAIDRIVPDNAPFALSSTISASGTTAASTGVFTGGYPTVLVQLAGAWSVGTVGLISFEVSNDNTFFFPQACVAASGSITSGVQVSTSTLASGIYTCQTNGALFFRLNALTWVNGNIASVVGRLVGK